MKKNLKLATFFLRAFLIGMLLSPSVFAATATEAISPYGGFNIPISKNGVQDIDRKWSPAETLPNISGTTCLNPFDGEGMVVGICGIGLTASGYVSLRDTSTVTSDSSTDFAWAYTVDVASTGVTSVQKASCTEYPDGVKFSTGLAICANAAGTNWTIRYRRLKKVP